MTTAEQGTTSATVRLDEALGRALVVRDDDVDYSDLATHEWRDFLRGTGYLDRAHGILRDLGPLLNALEEVGVVSKGHMDTTVARIYAETAWEYDA